MIAQTCHKLRSDVEKYCRELSEDCGVKRVVSTLEPPFVKADEKLRRKKKKKKNRKLLC